MTLPPLLDAIESSRTEEEFKRYEARKKLVAKEIIDDMHKSTPFPAKKFDGYSERMSLASFHTAIGEGIPEGTAIVDEALTSSGPTMRRAVSKKDAYLFGRKGGGTGNDLPMALGVKTAMLNRPVICISGDRSAMYTNQTLWTTAKYGIEVVFIIANNGEYHIPKERVLLLDGKAKEFNQFVGMEFHDPDLDFLKLASSMGVPATRTKKTSELENHIKTALQSEKPHFIDAIIQTKPL